MPRCARSCSDVRGGCRIGGCSSVTAATAVEEVSAVAGAPVRSVRTATTAAAKLVALTTTTAEIQARRTRSLRARRRSSSSGGRSNGGSSNNGSARRRNSDISDLHINRFFREQPREASMRVRQRGNDRAATDPHCGRDLDLGQVSDVTQHDDRALPRGQEMNDLPRPSAGAGTSTNGVLREESTLNASAALATPQLVQHDPKRPTRGRLHAPHPLPRANARVNASSTASRITSRFPPTSTREATTRGWLATYHSSKSTGSSSTPLVSHDTPRNVGSTHSHNERRAGNLSRWARPGGP